MKYTHFSKGERNELSILLKKGYSIRSIAAAIGKSPPSVSREIAKNSVNGIYDPRKANHKAYIRRHFAKYQAMKISGNSKLEQYIVTKLETGWTPQEIVERLRVEHGRPVISFKLIYQWLSTVRGQPYRKFLASRRSKWKNKKDRRRGGFSIKNRVSIAERPKAINQRTRLGDFECDVLGSPKADAECIAGVVDRKARFIDLLKVERIGMAMEAYQHLLACHDARSGTLDNGVENGQHDALSVPTYFCDPYSAWQKGTMENTFQRLRRFIHKRAQPSQFSDEAISGIVETMNNTPRACLNWRTPKEVFYRLPLEKTYQQFTIIHYPLPRCECCT